MAKITTDVDYSETEAEFKTKLINVLEWWGEDVSAYITWANARAGLNTLLDVADKITDYESAGDFIPKINYLNAPEDIIEGMFSTAEPSVWLDASEDVTMFTDTSGASPAGFGEAVALMLDKSGNGYHASQEIAEKRPILGREPATGRRNEFTNSGDTEASPWAGNSTGTGFGSVTEAVAYLPGATGRKYTGDGASSSVNRRQTVTLQAGTTYTFSIWAEKDTVSTFQFGFYSGSFLFLNTVNFDSGTISGGGTPSVEAIGSGPNGGALVRAIVSYTPASTVTGSLYIYPLAIAGSSGSTILHGAQMELGSTATAYQRVGSQYDVTETGVVSKSYLAFDGVDDYLVTPTITPGTDKVQVFAGVRKLSDAATGIMVEFSRDVNSNAGSFYMLSPRSAALNEPMFASRGSGGAVLAGTASNAFPAPRTDVLAGLGDISAPSAARRVSGTQFTTAASQGAGNYGAHELHIGARYGSIVPFKGRIYGLIVRFGSNLTDEQITRVERYIANKTGVSI